VVDGPRWTQTGPRIFAVDSLSELSGIAGPPACAERSETILTPAMAYLEAVGDLYAEGEVRHRSGYSVEFLPLDPTVISWSV
jgi:hypothetical protein